MTATSRNSCRNCGSPGSECRCCSASCCRCPSRPGSRSSTAHSGPCTWPACCSPPSPPPAVRPRRVPPPGLPPAPEGAAGPDGQPARLARARHRGLRHLVRGSARGQRRRPRRRDPGARRADCCHLRRAVVRASAGRASTPTAAPFPARLVRIVWAVSRWVID